MLSGKTKRCPPVSYEWEKKASRLAGEEQLNAVKLLELPARQLPGKRLYNLETGLPGEKKGWEGKIARALTSKLFSPAVRARRGRHMIELAPR